MLVERLKTKAIKGIAWALIDRVGVQSATFLVGIILARLLMPKDFGIIGIATVFFSIAQVFIDGGFGSAYIQKKEVTDIDANTIFFVNLFISFFAYLMIWILAPVIARFYEQPILEDLLRVMGIVIIINAFSIVQIAQLSRAIDFKRKTKIALSATIIAGTVGVIAAIVGLGVWSLAIYNLSNRLLITIGLWITSKWSPKIQFSRNSFKSLFSFGSWVLLAGIVRVLFNNLYVLVIGKLFPISQLGFYSKAKQFQRTTSTQIAGAVSVVAFPLLSQMQDDKPKHKSAIAKFIKHTLFFTVPLMVTLMVVAKPVVIIFLTDKWAPMIPYLQWLSILGIMTPVHMLNIQVLLAQGKSSLNLRLNVIKNGLRILNLILMYRFGVMYIIYGEVILSIVSLIINTFYTGRLVGYGFFAQMRDIGNYVISALVAAMLGVVVNSYIDSLWGKLLGGIFVMVIIYLGMQFLFNRKFLYETIKLRRTLVS